MNGSRLALCASLALVAAMSPAGSFAGQKNPPPPSSPTPRSGSNFSSGSTSLSSSNKSAAPLPHDTHLKNFLAPQPPGSPSKLQGQKGIISPNFGAQVHNTGIPQSTYKTPLRNGGKPGSLQGRIDSPLPFGGPKAVTTREKDRTVRTNPSSNAGLRR
jgi:hypothetical protein